ncbi:MAG: LL-diaminopimelate aminotransferase [Methanobrevibacter sp.]|jgi:LL-diaminopimelate aminotransferase|nr:LL-diaminopimelate aminotransferase [Methanobrevibacter sp.]
MVVKINENYLLLQNSYLFAEIAKRVEKFQEENPNKDIIKMGIGDVTKPLSPTVIKAFKDAVDEMGDPNHFMGYGPEQGYAFLQEAIIKHDFNPLGIDLDIDEVFVSDGAKCDTGNIQEIFSNDCVVAITDPVYPVYVDTNVMAGRTGPINESGEDEGRYDGLVYLPCTEENDFVPELPKEDVDLIYLCFPNNPTGTTLNKDQLSKFVKYAQDNQAIILFDAAYEKFITEDDVPHSIYEIEGAKEVAIEFRSFSKTAGFTGTRCAYTVVPKELKAYDSEGNKQSINKLWNRRQTTKFNGVSYPVQRAAEATFSESGKKETEENIAYYMKNAEVIKNSLEKIGLKVYGGINSPYIWIKTPNNMDSWDFFDLLLNEANVVGTPGAGFGPSGEGYLRLTAFNTLENTKEAMKRLSKLSF